MIEKTIDYRNTKGLNSTFDILGAKIKIPKKAVVTSLPAGTKAKYCSDHIEVIIEIGDHNAASLIMSIAAWEALNDGEVIRIEKLN